MNIKKLREILAIPASDANLRSAVLEMLAEDENVIPDLLEILHYERQQDKKLRQELNLELGRAHVVIRDKKVYKKLQSFVDEEICKFYKKWKGKIGHCFANMDSLKPINHESANNTDLDQGYASKPGS